MIRLSITAGLLAMAAFAGPAISKDAAGLVIQSGETWVFRIEQGQPVNAHKTDANAKPAAGELLVTLSPKMGTLMFVTNNTDKFYDYRAFMLRQLGDGGERTSVCTLLNGGRGAVENWPYPIAAIRISDFTEADENHMQCR